MIRVGPWAKRLLHDVATAPWARPGVSESVEAIPKFGFQLREHPSGSAPQPGKPRGRLSYLEESLSKGRHLRRESFGPTIVPHLDTAFEHKVAPGRRESPQPLSSFGRLAPQGLMK